MPCCRKRGAWEAGVCVWACQHCPPTPSLALSLCHHQQGCQLEGCHGARRYPPAFGAWLPKHRRRPRRATASQTDRQNDDGLTRAGRFGPRAAVAFNCVSARVHASHVAPVRVMTLIGAGVTAFAFATCGHIQRGVWFLVDVVGVCVCVYVKGGMGREAMAWFAYLSTWW